MDDETRITMLGVEGSRTIVISSDEDPANSLRLRGMIEVVQLRVRLTEYLDTLELDGMVEAYDVLVEEDYISTVEAQMIASDRGIRLPITTVRTAVIDGHIAGRIKPRGRWKMPRRNFIKWLSIYEQSGRRDDVRLGNPEGFQADGLPRSNGDTLPGVSSHTHV